GGSTGGGFAGGSTGGGFAGGSTGGGFAGGSTGGGAAVPGDTCATAIAMTPISATQFTASASLTGAADDHSGTCGGAGSDLVFSFVVTQASDVSFAITSIGGSSTPVGYLRRDDCTTELRCHTGTSTSMPVTLQPGSYRLVIDALSTTASGSFTANVVLSMPGPLVGDDCSSAEVLTVTSGAASATGETVGYNQTITTSACGSTGPDRFYRFTLSSSSNVTATVTPGSGALAGVYLLGPTTISGCASAPELDCGESLSLGGSATATGTALPAGTWYVAVKNRGSVSSPFSLSLTTTPAGVVGDSCSSAVPLSFSGGSASANGTLSGAANDRSSSCASTNADVVYSFTATAGQVLTAMATPGASWRPILTLTSGSSCSSATENTCIAATSAGSSASLTTAPLAAGTHYLWVDSVSGVGTPGSFSLSATLSSGSATGESCSGPIPLTFVSGSASATGTTTTAVDDRTTVCGGSGPDRVYSFTVSTTRTLNASLTPNSGFTNPILALTGPNSVCTSAPEITCSGGSGVTGTRTISRSLSAGTYYLWVDGYSSSAGSYTLSATLN
ncbi:MAG: hypothetical protein JNJ54_17300, partial [Myxococcaceae bacterium]|nr:hypothetical protein [Myxococcaceae bacterium]